MAELLAESAPRIALVERIDALLPQTQCGRCGYPACRPYAEAIAGGQADINQCPPGGQIGIEALAALLGRAPKTLNPANGVEKPREIARIDEGECIGCTKCIAACPVDAIVGASKLMHTILVDECTGCELCIPPCPVDCIAMIVDRVVFAAAQRHERADHWRTRFESRNGRLAREQAERASELAAKKTAVDAQFARTDAVHDAIARVRAKKARQQ